MYDPKDKAIGGIQMMLEKRMSGRLMPKKKPEDDNENEMSSDEEGSPNEESMESEGDESLEKLGGDPSMLSDEEKSQLKMLLDKMGC